MVGNSTAIRVDNLGLLDCDKCCKAETCHWTGTISGNLIIPIYVGGWANMKISATGTSDEAPNCFWTGVGEGHRWIPGGGMAVGWVKGSVSIDIYAPCEWPVRENDIGVIAWVGVGGSAFLPVNLTWTSGNVGTLRGSDWFGIGGVNVFVGGGGFMADMEIKRGKGCFE